MCLLGSDYLHAKIKEIHWFFPILLLIKESFNLIGWETPQATTIQNVLVSGAIYPDDFLHAKMNHLVLFTDIDDQRILLSDWMSDTTSHTQPKVAVSDAASP